LVVATPAIHLGAAAAFPDTLLTVLWTVAVVDVTAAAANAVAGVLHSDPASGPETMGLVVVEGDETAKMRSEPECTLVAPSVTAPVLVGTAASTVHTAPEP
jgi:hypothetical protein